MKPTRLFHLCLSLALGLAASARVSVAEEPIDQPTNLIIIQDEDKELSRVQTVFYSAEREASIELLVMGAVELGRDATLVTVISPDGVTDQISSEGQPLVTIENVRQGLHAIVASSASTHGTKLVNFQPEGKDDLPDPADEIGRGLDPTPPTQMTLAVTGAEQLRPFVDRIRGLRYEGADSEFVDPTDVRKTFNYRIALRADGTLIGRVYSVFKNPASVSVEGTRIGIIQDGTAVASTTCDANGDFEVPDIEPGAYGLIAAGQAGYAAFAFAAEADVAELAVNDSQGQKFVSKIQPQPELLPEVLPVVLIPPSMCPEVIEAITETFPALRWRTDVTQSPPGAPFGFPVGGTMVSPTPTPTGAGGGTVGSSPAVSGLSGVTGLTGLLGAAATANGGSNQGLQTPPVASPSFPGN